MARPTKPLQPSLQGLPKGKASSTKAHNGSSKSGHASSHKQTHSSQKHVGHKSKDGAKADTVERFVRDERDHRSYAVREFDAHQEAARTRHRDDLVNVVGRGYD